MRMTNKIMQSNSLYNINQTKIAEDKYNTQLTSQSKITRPSDDPVVAIRALRLRTNVSTATQYYDKNAPDAEQWLEVTAKSIDTITKVIDDLHDKVQTGVNKEYTASDMQVLLTQLESQTDEFYATGNQDYAGRYIFTGYRTDTPLTMQDNQIADASYEITENIKAAQVDSFKYTDFSVFNTTASAANADELDITNAELHRIRLSYGTLDSNTLPTLEFTDKTGATVNPLSGVTPTIATSAEAAYQQMTQVENTSPVTPTAIFVPTTGEILLSSDIAANVSDTLSDGGSVSVTYKKDSWNTGDLNPQHYFKCTDTNTKITYNADGNVDTHIEYDVGYNQTIQVNTNAYEVFDPAVARDLQDLRTLVNQFVDIEKIRTDLKEELKGYVEGTSDYKDCQKRLDAADKAYTYVREAVSDRFGDQMTRYKSYLNSTNVASTKNGTRSTRLTLISNRLEQQKSTFKELQEENEGIDMTEVAVLLTAAETTYDAALMATGKIMQNSLINYI